MTELEPIAAIEQLTMHQQQLDMDGVFVGVSRQALDELLAYVTRADGWQDIADAPRDGTWIWICDNRYKPSESSHLIAKWHPQLNCWQGRMNTKGRFTVWHEATHWQPLPTPPGGDHD